MANRALILHCEPEIVFYSGERPAGYDIARPRLSDLSAIRHELRIEGGANGSATVTLDNGDGVLTTGLLDAPLRTGATITEDGETLFQGQLTRVRPGPDAQLDFEAGHPLRFTDHVPLRTTAGWAEYTEIKPLPQVYGHVTLTPIRYDDSGHLWLIADHPIVGVDSVELDGAEISTWILQQSTDSSGEPVAVLETLNQYDQPGRLAITVRGKPHPETGELMERPDHVLWDFLANVCGLNYTAADFDDLRSASQAQSLTVGGVINDDVVTVQTWADRICQGAGLAWSPEADGVAMLWPADPVAPVEPDWVLNQATSPALSSEADQRQLATVLELSYDYDAAKRDHRRTLRLTCPAAIETYGEIEKRVRASWLHTPAAALAYATRLLQYSARPLWTVDATRKRGTYAPGDSLAVDHPYSPVTSVTITKIERRGNADRITAESPYGSAPAVELAAVGAGVDLSPLSVPVYNYQDGRLTFTVRDPDGDPLPGATVTLDGAVTRRTDQAGAVQFTASPGAHVLSISAAGYTDNVIDVVL